MTTDNTHAADTCPRADDGRAAVVTCGTCRAQWCERCDPAPGALCHTCNGRGYSTAEIRAGVIPPEPVERVTRPAPAPREYRGVMIHPAGLNSSGIRWTARYDGRALRADTLAGMRELIREYSAERR